MHERINCFLHILQVYLTSLSIGYSLNTSELTSMVTFEQAVCEGTLYCVVTSWCYHVNQQPFNLKKTLYKTDPRIMKIWVFQKIPQLKKLRLHFTTSIFLLNIWPFWGIFFPDFFSRNCVCVWEKGIFFFKVKWMLFSLFPMGCFKFFMG